MSPSPRSTVIISPQAPKPNGNYTHAIHVGSTLHLCGFMGGHPESGAIVPGDIEAQTERAILNIKAVLEAADPPVSR